MITEVQFDLFGGEPIVRRSKTRFENGPKASQLTLFSGLDCLPDQMNLFADDGVPDDLVAAVVEPVIEDPKGLEVTLHAEVIEDSALKRVMKFELRNKQTGEVMFTTQTKEHRKGVRQWSQAELYTARSRMRKWCADHNATIVEKE